MRPALDTEGEGKEIRGPETALAVTTTSVDCAVAAHSPQTAHPQAPKQQAYTSEDTSPAPRQRPNSLAKKETSSKNDSLAKPRNTETTTGAAQENGGLDPVVVDTSGRCFL